MGRQFVAPSFEKFKRATGVWGVDAAGEQPARLHHLVAGVMHRCGGMITGSNEGELVSQFCVQREYLGNLNIWIIGLDRLEWSADFRRRIWLHVPGINLTARAEI